MHRLIPVIALLVLASCKAEHQPIADAQSNRAVPEPAPVAVAKPPSKQEVAGAKDAASALRAYYALIEQGDYGGATRLRSDGRTDPQKLADNFKAYESYHAQVGVPGRPVRGGDWLYVRVQVMITGNYKGAEEFISAVPVTMRRSVPDSPTPAEREWRVYTG